MSTEQYPVEKEAIIRSPGRVTKYPFQTMEVGDCFYQHRDDKGQIPNYSGIQTSRRYLEGKLPGRKFDIRAVSVGLRVQRVE